MKTLSNKRRFLAALSAALLILAALVAGCTNEFDEHNKLDDNIIIPKGKGIVRLSIADDFARTIYPASLPALNTMVYDIDIVGRKSTGAQEEHLPKQSLLNAQRAILLAADTYDITITAWDAATEAISLAGWENAPTAGIVVAGSTSTPVTVNLRGWTTSGNGTFKYDITVPALPTKASSTWGSLTAEPGSYSLKQLHILNSSNAHVASAGSPITLNVGSNVESTGISLPAGYYTVKILLQAANCQDRVVSSVLHIYNTMESNWNNPAPTVPALNQDKFTVKFDINLATFAADANNKYLNDGSTNPVGGDTTDYSGRGTQAPLAFLAGVQNPGVPSCATHTFEGWFKNAAGTGTAWILSTDKVYEDTTLYAKWTPVSVPTPGVTIGITFTVTDGQIATPVVANPAGAITYDGLKGTQTVTLTFDGGPYNSGVEWDMDGVGLSDSTSTTLTIDKNFSELSRLMAGNHVINVRATKTSDGQKYSGSVSITITPSP